ncbi:hypothetical protein B0A49_08345 [Cryomyces minteri]|uniref:Cell morphogenesis protein N-terminal domain-containing protein n=1 Tax=Cryomyces minteri TaxID=331657 RepID=A0A4U0X111_9PEZI|nr:hypothetical protein B0A49_08345 [Cryomyces minteri]
MSVILCVAPLDLFTTQWLQLVLPLQARLKERTTRATTLKAICRLVWRYLYRTTETSNVTAKKLDDIIKLVFQPGKRSYLSTDESIAEPLIQLIRIIGYKHQDLCFRTIIFPLMNAESFLSGRELKVDNLEPERMVIGIRAFLAIMADLEKAEPPPFPVTFESDVFNEPSTTTPVPLSPRPLPHNNKSSNREERLSRPVITSGFGDVAKESYVKFCKILGEITIICDNTFGGQAVLDEKFASQTPKTPMADAFSFSRSRDDHTNAIDPRQGFYDLLHVAVRALPRCLSPHIPFNSLVNLLCTGTAHVQSHVATSSAQSLKSIARQSHAQQVTIGFARFIFNFDDRYSTMSDGGMLGPGHIESTLRLYVELLQIWIEDLKQKTKKAAFDLAEDSNSGNRGAQLDLSGVWAHVDEIESHGLFFLCSPSRRVRSFAVTVLRLVTEFDTALGKDSTRIIRILQGSPQRVMDVNDEKLSVAERSRLQRGMRKSNVHSTLVELCSSDVAYDSTLWFKVFPNLIRISSETCPFAVALTRDIVCARLSQMHKAVGALAEGTRSHQYSAFEAAFVPSRTVGRLTTTPPEVVIEQWKLHLIFACTTLTNTRTQHTAAAQDSQHTRKSSKSSQHNGDKIESAGELFSKVMPLLQVTNASIRDAIVVGLGSINRNLYRTLLESMQPSVAICNDEAKMRLGRHQRTASSPRRSHRTDHLRTEVTHIYKLTSHLLHTRETYNDDWILNNLITYTKDLRLFLNDAEVQNEWGFQKLRTHYCGLVETLYEGVKKTKDPLRWMPFQSRKAAFALMEDWCGYSPNQNQIRQREDSMRRSVLDREHDMGNKGIVTASMEIEKRDLRTAALSSMAALCGGPVSITTESKVNLQFDVRRMLSWIDTIFDTVSDKTHAIGRRALKNLITHNREHAYLLGRSIEMCYIAKSPKALASYFEVVTQILTECDDHMPPFWRVLCAGLYTLGNDSSEIRMKSVRLLRVLEERLRKSSKLQDLDISVSDKTTAVYKAAQFEVSLRLTKQHAEMAFHVFSEFSTYFKILQPDHQRNMVAAMLPWIQTIELQLDPNGGPTATSYMLLVNLFEITVRCSTALHNEILALWQALATGPHAGNVQLVLDFIINLCLEKKEQNFVDYAKQIVVFLSGTPAGLKVVDFLLLQINPKAMVVEKRETAPVPQDFVSLPYLADLSQVLPIGSGNKPAGLSLGQLCLILLVDLVVSPNKLPPAKVPLLLQVVLVLWDHYTPLVQDQAREMLVHLIHELVISQIDDRTTDPDKQAIEDLIDSIRRHESKVVWSYDDNNGEADNDNDIRVPQAMSFITEEVVKVFAHIHPSLREDWGKMTLTWATSCAVRHIACRSFQIFRCVLTTLDPQMLADMLARLSNTIADDNNDYLTFSMEILTTIKTIIEALEPVDLIKYPQLFWTTAACLDTIFEREFMESLSMLERLLDKLDLSDPAVIKLLIGSQPPKWEGTFEGLQSPVYKGLRSRVCLDRSVHVLDRLTALPSSELVGNDSRLLFAVLANLPRYLRFFEQGTVDPSCISSAELLAGVAEGQGHDDLARALQGFATTRYRADKEFLSQTVFGLRSAFFPEFEYKCLTFLMGLLTNPLPWFRTKTMQLLCVIAPEIDMRKPEITSHGSDLISPLLRLLQTEYCSQALEVLDNIMTMSGTPMDNKHLRMSMAGAHSNRATRKEYESTKCLYGIPEETGWSIPMPAVYSRMTRSNVHAVFYTCASTEATGVEEAATPEIEFHEEYQYSYFPDRTATMMSDDARGDGNMGELVMKLDSLDDFFEDSVSEETLTRQNSHALAAQAARYANGTGGVREDLYDQQTLPILHKSLQHNTSVTSFQTNFGDLKLPPASRDPEVMTPTAFNLPATTTTLARPGLPPRSLTSPGQRDQYQASQPPDLLSGDEGGDEPLSDDDSSIGRSAPSDKSFSLENIIRPGHGLRSNLRSGMRRLTGGGGGGGGPDVREKEKLRDAVRAQLLQKNPRVPKVPDVYLQNPKSADP